MSTSAEVMKSLEQALTATHTALKQIDDLVVTHDYQDVASLVANAAASLLQSAHHLMQSKDEDAFASLEAADDYLDAVYDIIDSETEEDDF
jgi:light-regulated signal transduction histidine kinase (bacteriophytochrome)